MGSTRLQAKLSLFANSLRLHPLSDIQTLTFTCLQRNALEVFLCMSHSTFHHNVKASRGFTKNTGLGTSMVPCPQLAHSSKEPKRPAGPQGPCCWSILSAGLPIMPASHKVWDSFCLPVLGPMPTAGATKHQTRSQTCFSAMQIAALCQRQQNNKWSNICPMRFPWLICASSFQVRWIESSSRKKITTNFASEAA